ncbi:MAG: YkgJ family cysteine cluster protein [Candidatus Nezhaarchaeales archaeon]
MTHEHVKILQGEKVKVTCLRCGRCCNGPNVSLTVFDICRIASFLNVHWRELRGKYIIAVIADMLAIPVLKSKGGLCIFLETSEKPSCKIYPARPMRCRLYPFIPYSPGKTNIINLDKCCQGVGIGDPIEPPWNLIENYYLEVKYHYSKLYHLVFSEGYEPLNALETLLDEVYEVMNGKQREACPITLNHETFKMDFSRLTTSMN